MITEVLLLPGTNPPTNQLVGRTRRSLELATEQGQLSTRLFELTAALIGQTDLDAIAAIVLQQLQAAFRPERIELHLGIEPGGRRVRRSSPAEAGPPHGRPPVSYPLQGPQGLLGEINLWMAHLGIESGNQATLDGVGKKVKLEQVVEACRVLKSAGVKVFGFVMLYHAWEEGGELRWETPDDVDATLGDSSNASMIMRRRPNCSCKRPNGWLSNITCSESGRRLISISGMAIAS